MLGLKVDGYKHLTGHKLSVEQMKSIYFMLPCFKPTILEASSMNSMLK